MEKDLARAFMEGLVHKRKTIKELTSSINKFFGVKVPIQFVEMTTEVDCDFRLIFDVTPDHQPKHADVCGSYEIWFLDTRKNIDGLNVKYITEVNCDFN